MNQKFILIISSFLLSSCLLQVRFNLVEVEASDEYRIHNLNTGLNYTLIQKAIDANETENGHTILVDNGIYNERVIVNKALSLIGEDANKTIIDGIDAGNAMELKADNITIMGFTIRNCGVGWGGHALLLENVKNCKIFGNIIESNYYGIWLFSSFNISMRENNLINNNVGILLNSCFNNSISKNNMTNKNYGIELISSTNNIIARNDITGNSNGVALCLSSNNNRVYENNIKNNVWGLEVDISINNKIYHNNFTDNTYQVFIYQSSSSYPNIWDDGYPSGGNYWSDYIGTDSNHDGIGDSNYTIDANNNDRYPLMGMFSSFNTSIGCNVDAISNSTIDDFEYFESNDTIVMHVSNMTSNQTFGFVRICIPHALMNETYQVIINGGEPYYVNYTLYDNGTHRWIYFSYQHSTLEIIITPEFPSFLILPLFMIATLVVAIVYRRKHTITA